MTRPPPRRRAAPSRGPGAAGSGAAGSEACSKSLNSDSWSGSTFSELGPNLCWLASLICSTTFASARLALFSSPFRPSISLAIAAARADMSAAAFEFSAASASARASLAFNAARRNATLSASPIPCMSCELIMAILSHMQRCIRL